MVRVEWSLESETPKTEFFSRCVIFKHLYRSIFQINYFIFEKETHENDWKIIQTQILDDEKLFNLSAPLFLPLYNGTNNT